MNFHRNDITPSRPLEFQEEISFPEVGESAYPLLKISACSFGGIIRKIDGILHLSGQIDAKLVLSDARTLAAVDYRLKQDVDFDLLSSEEEEGEGYVFPENRIELSDIAYALILTLMPKAYSKAKGLPASGEGYTVYREGEEEPLSSPFDVLNPDDLD
ncbi:MAG: hypothetical protein IJU64_05120 [Bacilli bacterium]|nr:hypothetical protein [Bacilli bacterium]